MKEYTLTILVIILGFFLLNPFDFFMSNMIYVICSGLLLVVGVFFVGVLISEKALDEREEKHRASAGRVGYLLGLLVALIGILVQSITDMVDPWLVFVALSMVVGKLIARIYKRKHE